LSEVNVAEYVTCKLKDISGGLSPKKIEKKEEERVPER
jgi:hypothetical protein